MHSDAAHPERVAVCLAGWYGGLVSDDRGRSLRQNLIDPLQASLLMALNYRAEDGCSSEQSCGLHERFAGLRPWERLAMTRRRTAVELAAELEQLRHWPKLLAPFNEAGRKEKGRKGTTFCKRKPDGGAGEADGSPYHCRIAKGWASTFLMPVLGSPRGTALHELRDASTCLRELLEAEQGLASRRFSRVVFSRLSHVWLRPHPPLSLLGGECVWLPLGVDGGGLTTRHAVLRRSAAEAYLGRFDRILDGRVLLEHPLGRGQLSALSPERHLAAVLKHRNLSACRFPATAYLGCDNLTLTSLTGLPKRRRFPRGVEGDNSGQQGPTVAAAAGTAVGMAVGSYPAIPAALATRLLEGRTHQEMDLVIEHVLALALPGARLAPLTRSAAAVAGGFWVLPDRLGLAITAAPAQKAPFLALLPRLRELRHPVRTTSSPLIVWQDHQK